MRDRLRNASAAMVGIIGVIAGLGAIAAVPGHDLPLGVRDAVLVAAGISAVAALLPLRQRVKAALMATAAALAAVSFALWCIWL